MQKRDYFFLLAILASPGCGGRIELDSPTPTASTAAASSIGGTSGATNGGTTSTGGDYQGTGCTGSLELIQTTTGLCVARMATITAPNGFPDYSIDATEVTKGQYDAWLATNPPLPPSTDANCGYITSYAEQGEGYTGMDADHHPVVYVDWCDAYAYCLGVDKRLCGAIGGGTVGPHGDLNDATQSQWYRACSSGGTYEYPYGDTYDQSTCDGQDYWNGNYSAMQTVAVGSLTDCVTFVTGYSGVYDLSGDVSEWEDSCSGTASSGYCYNRGGSFSNDSKYALACAVDYDNVSNYSLADSGIGFRCCSL